LVVLPVLLLLLLLLLKLLALSLVLRVQLGGPFVRVVR